MKEMIEIEKHITKVYSKFIKQKKPNQDYFTRDMWFAMNLMVLALRNLKRWSEATPIPKQSFKQTIKECVDQVEGRLN